MLFGNSVERYQLSPAAKDRIAVLPAHRLLGVLRERGATLVSEEGDVLLMPIRNGNEIEVNLKDGGVIWAEKSSDKACKFEVTEPSR